MSAETFSYKGISAGKYIEGEIEALNQEEASFKLKEQKVIITNLVKVKKKKAAKDKKKGGGFSFGKKAVNFRQNFVDHVLKNCVTKIQDINFKRIY